MIAAVCCAPSSSRERLVARVHTTQAVVTRPRSHRSAARPPSVAPTILS